MAAFMPREDSARSLQADMCLVHGLAAELVPWFLRLMHDGRRRDGGGEIAVGHGTGPSSTSCLLGGRERLAPTLPWREPALGQDRR